MPSQYYDRTSEIVGRIKEVLDTDITNDDSVGKLEDFKKAANAYGEEHMQQLVFDEGTSWFILHIASNFSFTALICVLAQWRTTGVSYHQDRRALLKSTVGHLTHITSDLYSYGQTKHREAMELTLSLIIGDTYVVLCTSLYCRKGACRWLSARHGTHVIYVLLADACDVTRFISCAHRGRHSHDRALYRLWTGQEALPS